jgi:hypothetical protein
MTRNFPASPHLAERRKDHAIHSAIRLRRLADERWKVRRRPHLQDLGADSDQWTGARMGAHPLHSLPRGSTPSSTELTSALPMTEPTL